MSHIERDFAGQIRQKGYRMTPQRQLVLDVLCARGSHVTACEVVTAVQTHSSALNRTTVYRILDFLCAQQMVTRTEFGGQTMYELAPEQPHHHLICRVCGHTAVWNGRYLPELTAHLLVEHQFHAELNHLAISGVCEECSTSGIP